MTADVCTGPRPLVHIGADERATVSDLFRDQVRTWIDFWHDFPSHDTLKIFWNRARWDAHALLRPRSTWESAFETE